MIDDCTCVESVRYVTLFSFSVHINYIFVNVCCSKMKNDDSWMKNWNSFNWTYIKWTTFRRSGRLGFLKPFATQGLDDPRRIQMEKCVVWANMFGKLGWVSLNPNAGFGHNLTEYWSTWTRRTGCSTKWIYSILRIWIFLLFLFYIYS